jgi:hypothetical protein
LYAQRLTDPDRHALGHLSEENRQMADPVDLYKSFVDGLTGVHAQSVEAARARRGVWNPNKPAPGDSEVLRESLIQQQKYNKLLKALSPEQRELLAQMLQETHDGGMHSVLVYLNEQMSLAGLRLSYNGVELPVEPFGTELFFDWCARRDRADWPE